MACLSESFYPAAVLHKCATPMFVVYYVGLLLFLLKAPDRQEHEKWSAILEQMGFSLCRMPGDLAPDIGHDRGEQSSSSGCRDTFGPGRCRDGGRNEQIHGQRSFRCTAFPGSLRPARNTV